MFSLLAVQDTSLCSESKCNASLVPTKPTSLQLASPYQKFTGCFPLPEIHLFPDKPGEQFPKGNSSASATIRGLPLIPPSPLQADYRRLSQHNHPVTGSRCWEHLTAGMLSNPF